MFSLYQDGFDPVKLRMEPARLQPDAEYGKRKKVNGRRLRSWR